MLQSIYPETGYPSPEYFVRVDQLSPTDTRAIVAKPLLAVDYYSNRLLAGADNPDEMCKIMNTRFANVKYILTNPQEYTAN